MEPQSTQEQPAGALSTQESPRPKRLIFSNAQQRSAHVQAFLEWLPNILHEVSTIRWENVPGPVMGYLIRNVANDADAIPIALATGYYAMSGAKEKVVYGACKDLTLLLRCLRREFGVTTLTELSQRSLWDRFVEGRMLTAGELKKLKRYDTFSSTYQEAFVSELTERQRVRWEPFLLPPLPAGFIKSKTQARAVDAVGQNRRKEQSEVILPLFPLLIEIAQLRKQAAERLIREFRKQCGRAKAGEIELPYQFQYGDRQFSVPEYAATLSEVHLVEREVTLSFTLWNRVRWAEEHSELCTRWIRRKVKHQQDAYTPSRNSYFLQYDGPSDDLLWCGEAIEKHLLGQGSLGEYFVTRPALLTPASSDGRWLTWARTLSGTVLFEPESLYRGYL